MRFFLTAIVFFFLVLPPTQAHAGKFCFGTDEDLRSIEKVDLQGPNGETLYLARLLRTECFVLPYTVSDQGYVLRVEGQNNYYQLDEAKIAEYQEQGSLPKPLPEFKLSNLDLIFGHLLWVTLVIVALWTLGSSLISRARGRDAE